MTKPLHPNRKLLALWRSLKPAQKIAFAGRAKTSPETLRQYVEGYRIIQPDLAIRIERATVAQGKRIDRSELSSVCGGCEYARYCKKVNLA